MKLSFQRSFFALLCMGWLLAGCSPQGGQPAASGAPTPQQAQDADAARKLDTYQQLLRIKNDEMAVTEGHDILDHSPGSAAAKEVQQTLPASDQRGKENSEKNRLASMWLYQVSPMAGGTQSTATITSAGSDRVQLILRRHTSWGQSVYLYGSSGHGFVCHGNCNLTGTVDDKPLHVAVFAPPTGEPALMFRDDKAFLVMLRKAKKITLDVTPTDNQRKETLVYEVGGFDPDKWAALPKQKKP